MAARRKLKSLLNCVIALLLVFAILAVVARYMFGPYDVTYDSKLNGGFIPHGVYTQQCRTAVVAAEKPDPTTRYCASPPDPDYVTRYVIDPKTGVPILVFSSWRLAPDYSLNELFGIRQKCLRMVAAIRLPTPRFSTVPARGNCSSYVTYRSSKNSNSAATEVQFAKPDPKFFETGFLRNGRKALPLIPHL